MLLALGIEALMLAMLITYLAADPVAAPRRERTLTLIDLATGPARDDAPPAPPPAAPAARSTPQPLPPVAAPPAPADWTVSRMQVAVAEPVAAAPEVAASAIAPGAVTTGGGSGRGSVGYDPYAGAGLPSGWAPPSRTAVAQFSPVGGSAVGERLLEAIRRQAAREAPGTHGGLTFLVALDRSGAASVRIVRASMEATAARHIAGIIETVCRADPSLVPTGVTEVQL